MFLFQYVAVTCNPMMAHFDSISLLFVDATSVIIQVVLLQVLSIYFSLSTSTTVLKLRSFEHAFLCRSSYVADFLNG
jgi:hypothetical protein